MQRRRNIRLLITLLVALVATITAYFATRPEDKLQVSRDIFSYDDPSHINKVVFTDQQGSHQLLFDRNQWHINDQYEADPQRVSVLFAILKQMRVRRKVSKQQEDSISSLLKKEGTQVRFYEQDQLVREFYVWGSDDNHLTYVANAPDAQAYIVEIPGYRSFLAGIFRLDVNGWRNPVVFDINWANLSAVQVVYPEQSESGFHVIYDDPFYKIEEISNTDSLKLTDFLDDLSLLYVNDYLSKVEQQEHKEIINTVPQASINVEDVGKNIHTLEIYQPLPEKKEIIGRVDSVDYAVFDMNTIRKIMRPRSFFEEKETKHIK